MARVKVATYNIHRCFGSDRRYEPARVGEVLREIGADLIGLQEVDTTLEVPEVEARAPNSGLVLEPLLSREHPENPAVLPRLHQLDYLSAVTGLHAVDGLVLHQRWGLYGNGLLSRFPIKQVRRVDLTVRGASERRGALDVDVDAGGVTLRVVVTHLGLQLWERHFQIGRLVKVLGADRQIPVVMMGDFNLWVSLFPKLRRFYGRLGHAPLFRTFPSRFPLFSFDRIWVQPFTALETMHVHRTPLSRLASDHLPLVGTIQF